MEAEPEEIKHRQIVLKSNAITLSGIAAFSVAMLLFIWGREPSSNVQVFAGVLFLIASTYSVMGVFACKAPIMANPQSEKAENTVDQMVVMSILMATVGSGILCWSISILYALVYVLALLTAFNYLFLTILHERIAKGLQKSVSVRQYFCSMLRIRKQPKKPKDSESDGT